MNHTKEELKEQLELLSKTLEDRIWSKCKADVAIQFENLPLTEKYSVHIACHIIDKRSGNGKTYVIWSPHKDIGLFWEFVG